jgi:hypothetical protein
MPGEALLAVRPRAGLCNRLAVLSSYEALADHTDRTFLLCWAPTTGFSDEDLNDLFENEYPRLNVAEFEELCGHALCLHDKIKLEGEAPRWVWDPAFGPEALRDGRRFPEVAYEGFLGLNHLIDSPAGKHLPDGFKAACAERLRALRPVASIRRAVDEVTDSFDDVTVGVHVRRGDAVIHPHLSGEYRKSSDRAFFNVMDALLRRDPRTRFFLATDQADTESRFRARYGEALLTNPAKRFVPSVVMAPKENQRDAVIDLYALARTRQILGTHYSTFSTTAATLGSIPFQTVYSGQERMRRKWRAARFKARLITRIPRKRD